MSNEIQRIIQRWIELEQQESFVIFPAWNHRLASAKQIKRANHKTINRHVDWYDMDQIRWNTAVHIQRLSENDTFFDWEILDIELQALRLGRFIPLATDAHLRAYLQDLQSLLEQIAQYLHLEIED